MSRSGSPFAPVEVATGVVVEERAQAAGECTSRGSAGHQLVLQSRDVPRTQQRWDGVRRDGPMRAGHVTLLPAGLPVRWCWDSPVQSLHVTIDRRLAADLTQGVLPPGARTAWRESSLSEHSLVRQHLEALRLQAAGGGSDPLRAELLVQRLILHLAGGPAAVRPPGSGLPPARLTAVLDWLEAHLDERISVHELAAVAGVEISWFTRLFRVSVGSSPYQYLLERRVVRAQQLLRDGTRPADVAPTCGFVDQAHLTRHFRRVLGVTPGVWAAALGLHRRVRPQRTEAPHRRRLASASRLRPVPMGRRQRRGRGVR